MKILLIPNNKKEHTAEVLKKTLEVIESYNTEYEILDLSDETQTDNIKAKGDIILYIGGDGTFIRSARLAYRLGIPIVGINTGKVGYLSKIAPEDAEQKLVSLIKGEYEVVETGVLSLKCDDKIIEPVINDAVFSATKLVDEFWVKQWDETVFRCCSSAVAISTAVGSTGLNKSAGGAVIMLGTDAVSITPVLAQSGDDYSLICQGNKTYTVSSNGQMQVSFDGEERFATDESIEVSSAQKMLKVVKL